MAGKEYLLVACLMLAAIVASIRAERVQFDDGREGKVRVKRQGGGRIQVPQGDNNNNNNNFNPQGRPFDVNFPNGAQATATSLTSALDPRPNLGLNQPNGQVDGPRLPNINDRRPEQQVEPPRRPPTQPMPTQDEPEGVPPRRRRPQRVRPTRPPSYEYDGPEAEYEDEEPPRDRRPRRRPSKKVNRGDEYEDEECDDEDYDPHYGLFQPMRHMARMMGDVFGQMQGMASEGFSNFPRGGGNMAVASSTSNSDGYSRVSSLVNNNGRTRGVISETRDGKTKTERIGDDGDDGDEE